MPETAASSQECRLTISRPKAASLWGFFAGKGPGPISMTTRRTGLSPKRDLRGRTQLGVRWRQCVVLWMPRTT
jgi:hypothetical protein